VFREIGRARRWGSAVVAIDPATTVDEIWSVRTRHSPQSFTLSNTFPGSVAIARARIPGIQPITFVSVYTVIDVYSQTTLLRVVADLIPLFDSVDGKRVILGGDLNLGTDQPRGPDLARYEAIIRAVEALGLVNLYERIADRPRRPDDCRCGRSDCRHLTTRTGGGQFDHLFASPELAPQCLRIVRFDDPESIALSDHWPIAADFALVASPAKRRWDVDSFAQEVGARHGAPAARAVDAIADWAERKERELHAAGFRRWTLTRLPVPDAIEPEMWLQLDLDGGRQVIQYTISIRARGDVAVQFQYIQWPPFDDQTRRAELAERLNAIEGIKLTRTSGRPTFPLEAISEPPRLEQLLGVIGWLVDKTVASWAVSEARDEPDTPAEAPGSPEL
jgi:hypothetical protein